MKKNITKKAGAIIMSRDLKSVALVFRPEKNDWTFPKGHVEEGETEIEAMMREILEETGVLVEIKNILPNIEYLDDNGKNVLVKMLLTIFVQNKPENKIGDEQIKWIPIDEVAQKLSYQNLKEYFSSIAVTLKDAIL